MIAGANRVPTVPDSPSKITRKKKPLDLQIRENQIEHQKLVIESQRSRLKQQQREIEDLKKMTTQLDQGKSWKNCHMVYVLGAFQLDGNSSFDSNLLCMFESS